MLNDSFYININALNCEYQLKPLIDIHGLVGSTPNSAFQGHLNFLAVT